MSHKQVLGIIVLEAAARVARGARACGHFGVVHVVDPLQNVRAPHATQTDE